MFKFSKLPKLAVWIEPPFLDNTLGTRGIKLINMLVAFVILVAVAASAGAILETAHDDARYCC